MAQNKKRSDAAWGIIAGTIMAIVGIVVMKTVRMHYNPEGEWRRCCSVDPCSLAGALSI